MPQGEDLNPQWFKTLGGGGKDNLFDLTIADGYVYVTGRDQRTIFDFDIYTAKYDLSANLIWQTDWQGGSFDSGFVIVKDGPYLYVGGKTGSRLGQEDAVILKYDLDGNLLWSRTWSRESNSYEEVDGLAVRGDTIFVSLWTGPILMDLDVGLLRYDLAGNLLGQTIWKGQWRNEANGHIYTDAAGVYITGGFREKVSQQADAYLAQFDLDGDYQWRRTWGESNKTENALNLASDGSFLYVTGYKGNENGPTKRDVFLLKFDLAGSLIWEQVVGGDDDDIARGIAVDDNAIWLSAKTKSYGKGGWDLAILKYDKNGGFLGYKLWGDTGDEEQHSLKVDQDYIYVVGETDSFNARSKDSFILKAAKW
jgi:outer membrane protein assembly factor BamB